MPKWLKIILEIVPFIARLFLPKGKKPKPIKITESVWDKRRKEEDN